MWARARSYTAAAALAGLVGLGTGGCSARAGGWFGRADSHPSVVLVDSPDRAAFDEGVSLVSELKYAEAEKKFFRVLQWAEASGDRARLAETKFWMGFCYEKQGRTEEARELYDHLVNKHRDSPAARQAAERLGQLPPP